MVSATCILDRSRWKKTVPWDLCAHLSYSASAGLAASLFATSTAEGSSSFGTIEGAMGAAMLSSIAACYRSIMGVVLQPRRKSCEGRRRAAHKKVRVEWSHCHVLGSTVSCGELFTSELQRLTHSGANPVSPRVSRPALGDRTYPGCTQYTKASTTIDNGCELITISGRDL